MSNPTSLPPGPWSWPPQRIEPAAPASLSRTARTVLRSIRRRTGDPTDFNVFLTFARLTRVFVPYSAFLSRLLGPTRLSPTEKELVLLRVSWRVGCAYEYVHHQRIASHLGVPESWIAAATTVVPDIPNPRTVALLESADELVRRRHLSDVSWNVLREYCSADDILELCMFVGHYVMVAMIVNTVGVQLERGYAVTAT